MRKTLLRSLREYKSEALQAPFFVVLEVLMEVLIPFIMTNIIDIGIAKGDLPYILKLGIILVIMALVSLTFGVIAGRRAATAAGYGKNLRHDVFYAVQDFSFGNIDHFSTSGLVTRLTTDVTNVQMAFMMTIRILARTPIMILLALIMTIKINGKIALLFLIAIPILGTGLALIVRAVHPVFEKVFSTYDILNNTVRENVRGVRTVKAYVREEEEIQKFKEVSQRVYDLFTKAEKLVALNGPLLQMTMYVVILLIYLVGGKGIVTGEMEVGELTAVMIYAMQILMSLMMVTFVFVMNMVSDASARRLEEVLLEKPSLTNPENPVEKVESGEVEFKNVSFRYEEEGEQDVLRNISLKIPSGETLGILGGTGSGKSTLVQLIPRLYDVREGSVTLGGKDVREYDLEELRDSVAVVLQKNVLFSGTIAENLRWGDENATDEEIRHWASVAQAADFVESFPEGYDTMLTQGGTNVSGGQKQRLCIARALLKKPKVLILDDSMSAVDTATERALTKGLRESLPDTTKIIISQRVSSLEGADRILVLHRGRVHGLGTSEELLEKDAIYREIYESQRKGEGV